jgi:L-methionine (R)-S-oxide reductase
MKRARNWNPVIAWVATASSSADGTIEARMQLVADAIWQFMHNAGVSWVGFYLDQPSEPGDRRLILGPSRDKPACSPIGLHGVCGQALVQMQTQIVRDVKDLGPMYIACDPRDQSEIVIPLIDSRGTCWAVLDVDSWDQGAFDQDDEAGLREVLAAAGLLLG